MNKRFWISLFAVILTANLIGGIIKNEWLEYFSKPLIVIILMAMLISRTRSVSSKLVRWVLPALIFSLTGDVLLTFQQKDQNFFLFGLAAFLIAHVFYIVFFHKVKEQEKVPGKFWTLLVVAAYYLGLISFLSPYLAEMKLPVRIYGLVISLMFMLSMHMLYIGKKQAGRLMMIGALLFVVSDSILALNKFYQSFASAGFFVMLSYGIAQLLITEGAIMYIRNPNDK